MFLTEIWIPPALRFARCATLSGLQRRSSVASRTRRDPNRKRKYFDGCFLPCGFLVGMTLYHASSRPYSGLDRRSGTKAYIRDPRRAGSHPPAWQVLLAKPLLARVYTCLPAVRALKSRPVNIMAGSDLADTSDERRRLEDL